MKADYTCGAGSQETDSQLQPRPQLLRRLEKLGMSLKEEKRRLADRSRGMR
jgi:hypothetical protein